MNVLIIGQGAIGLLFHTHLQVSSNNTLALLPSSRVKNSPEHYQYTHLNGDIETIPLTIANESFIQKCDLIITCVKSYQVVAALQNIMHLIDHNPVIVVAHNGMGVTEQLKSLMSKINNSRVYTLLTTHGAKMVAPYHVKHTGAGKIDIGLSIGTYSKVDKKLLLRLFEATFPMTVWHDNIKIAQWIKLAINCTINPITAINNIPNGAVIEVTYQKLLLSVLQEVIEVAKAEGVHLSADELYKTVVDVAQKTAKNSSSMRSDINTQRTTEIDYINGYIHQQGLKHSIKTPQNTKLLEHVLSISSYNH